MARLASMFTQQLQALEASGKADRSSSHTSHTPPLQRTHTSEPNDREDVNYKGNFISSMRKNQQSKLHQSYMMGEGKKTIKEPDKLIVVVVIIETYATPKDSSIAHTGVPHQSFRRVFGPSRTTYNAHPPTYTHAHIHTRIHTRARARAGEKKEKS